MTPTDATTTDPTAPRYWQPDALLAEIRRVAHVCHECRLCFKYCDTFPSLFALIDDRHGGDPTRLDDREARETFAHCFQCKLCEVQCPYTPREGHAWRVDFPRLVHRHQAVTRRAGRARLRLGDRLLADPDAAGRLARASLGLANVAARWRPARWLMEKVAGIHRDKLLPPFARRSFQSWAAAEGLIRKDPGGEAVLFPTCYVQHNRPDIGRDTVAVYRAAGVELRCARGLRCCGMPAWEQGDLARLRAGARANLDALLPFVERGAKVVAINPTCSMTMRREWPDLLDGEDRARARRLAESVRDASELLWEVRGEPRARAAFRSTPGAVAYHAPCHLRAQATGFRGRDLLRRIPGARLSMTLECSGHDGTFAMRVSGFEASRRLGGKALASMQDAGAAVWVSDCPLAGLQFAQHAGREALHPMTVLARALRAPDEGGFPEPVPDEGGKP